MTDPAAWRRFFAEEIQLTANIRTPALVEALASVPREQFLPPGPWTIRAESDMGQPLRHTPDADPRHVSHNVAVAIDPARMLFNGQPSLIAMAIDALNLQPGSRVLHIGTGNGYFTALMAHCAGPSGRVLGIEVDDGLAAQAATHLARERWVEVRRGDGSDPLNETFDAILVNAGVTHALEPWLDALAPGGRMVLPLTASMPAMGNIGKGPLLLISAQPDGRFAVRPLTFVAIYSALGIRDQAASDAIGRALAKQPFPALKTLRRDRHDQTDQCWLHTPSGCFSL